MNKQAAWIRDMVRELIGADREDEPVEIYAHDSVAELTAMEPASGQLVDRTARNQAVDELPN